MKTNRMQCKQVYISTYPHTHTHIKFISAAKCENLTIHLIRKARVYATYIEWKSIDIEHRFKTTLANIDKLLNKTISSNKFKAITNQKHYHTEIIKFKSQFFTIFWSNDSVFCKLMKHRTYALRWIFIDCLDLSIVFLRWFLSLLL